MKRIIAGVLFVIFIISIVAFAAYGKQIRDFNSAHVAVTTISERLLSNGIFAQVLLSSCIYEDSDGTKYAYIVEENSDFGERAYYAKRVELDIGNVDGDYIELISINEETAMYISSSDRDFTEGDRVVIERIVY